MNASEALKTRSMVGDDLVIRKGLSNISYDPRIARKSSSIKLLPAPSSSSHVVDGSSITTSNQQRRRRLRVDSVFSTVNKLVKGKLSMVGGADKVYRRIFSVREGEQLVRASRCCLSTTAGPIAGRLFISTDKIAFCSDRPVATVSSPTGEPLRFHYKIVIPLRKIERLNQTENEKKPAQKYVQVVTADNFEFWFLGFVRFKKTLKCLQQAVSHSNLSLLTLH